MMNKAGEEKKQGSLFERFVHSQVSGSLVLLAAALTAIVWANSPWSSFYHDLAHLDIGTFLNGRSYHLALEHWVKDGLMSIFFFVVGLEIKREILVGELSSVRRAILPMMAAVGGAVIPALIYFVFNRNGAEANGWAIPMATDIAFALGVLALFGKRVPIGLKVFLTALAIVDDLIAVLVIAIFYTDQISWSALLSAAALLGLLLFAIRAGVRQAGFYLGLVLLIWLAVFLSGVHATIAGVLIAMAVPIRPSLDTKTFFDTMCRQMERLRQEGPTCQSLITNRRQRDILTNIYLTAENMMPAGVYFEDRLHSIQAFLILPLFALFAAGVTVDKEMIAAFPGSVGLGIILGLVVGKQIGITLLSWLTVATGLAELPSGVRWPHIWAVSILAGIGFTMSIFISELGFTDPALIADAKLSIFIASLAAGIMGAFVLTRTLPSS